MDIRPTPSPSRARVTLPPLSPPHRCRHQEASLLAVSPSPHHPSMHLHPLPPPHAPLGPHAAPSRARATTQRLARGGSPLRPPHRTRPRAQHRRSTSLPRPRSQLRYRSQLAAYAVPTVRLPRRSGALRAAQSSSRPRPRTWCSCQAPRVAPAALRQGADVRPSQAQRARWGPPPQHPAPRRRPWRCRCAAGAAPARRLQRHSGASSAGARSCRRPHACRTPSQMTSAVRTTRDASLRPRPWPVYRPHSRRPQGGVGPRPPRRRDRAGHGAMGRGSPSAAASRAHLSRPRSRHAGTRTQLATPLRPRPSHRCSPCAATVGV